MRIGIVGTGNVAYHFAKLLKNRTVVRFIAGRNLEAAEKIAREVSGSTESFALDSELPADVDAYIIAVTDDAISDISRKLPYGPVLIHTCGSRSLDDLGTDRKRGVVYPLQTFSKNKEISEQFPVFIEASDGATEELVGKIAGYISNDVKTLDSRQRLCLHIAGVVVCNFVNYLLGSAYSIMDSSSINFKYLRPLVEETVDKAFSGCSPLSLQTGPARRGDNTTIELHKASLSGENADIYSFMTDLIKHKFKK